MFTGLVQAVGRIERVERRGAGAHLVVQAAPLDGAGLAVGDSIAVNGCCLTVTAIEGSRFHADLSDETLARTANLDQCGPVNLELSLTVGARIGGHLVLGHVDAAGTVVGFSAAADPDSRELRVRAPRALAPYLALKGSLAVDGVSLTINRVQDLEDGCDVTINLIPHTLDVTTLGQLSIGQRVNLEVDSLARYAERIISMMAPSADGKRT
ncbi:MAG TPA: riboflavin synthase [Burkholderiaceae bacterium]|jgi:riboflavin synthase|nr:riboflavin synthase [Burkholderiaceae bacterium]